MTAAVGRPSAETCDSREEPQLARVREPTRDVTELVHQHLDFVWRLLRRTGLCASDADDVSQQVFIVAADKLDNIEPGKERTFLYGTALRIAANVARTQRRRPELSEAALLAAIDERAGPERLLQLERLRLLLDELLDQLPEELRRVLVLAEIHECTTAVIAELEEIPAGTAASRLRRARARFQALLTEAQRQGRVEVSGEP